MTRENAAAPPTGSGVRLHRLLLILAGLSILVFGVYAGSWHNNLVLDDKTFLEYERFADVSAIGEYFGKQAWASWGVDSAMYRPLLFASVAVDANVFGDWFAGYHITNTALHAGVTLLVFAFMVQLLALDERTRDTRILVATLVAAVFAVHPAHTEIVNSVFNRSSMLAALGTLGGLWWLLRFRTTRPLVAWAGLFVAYSYAIYCRETALVLPGIAVVLILAYSEGNWRARGRAALPVLLLLGPAFVYLWMRGIALAPPEGADAHALNVALEQLGLAGQSGAQVAESSVLAGDGPGVASALKQLDSSNLFSGQVLLDVAGTWLQALYVSLWPFEPKLSYPNASGKLQFLGLILHAGLFGLGIILFARGRKGLLVGLAFFYLALLPSSRVIGGGSFPHLYERYLYEPLIGVLIVAAYGLSFLAQRFDRLLAAAPVVLILLLFIPVTWARNSEWASDLELFESEYRSGVFTPYTLRMITGIHLSQGNYRRIEEICDTQWQSGRMGLDFATHCGIALAALDRIDDAERAYLRGTVGLNSRTLAHYNLARLYLGQGRWDDAKAQFEKAVQTERQPAYKANYAGAMLMYLYPGSMEKREQAVRFFELALELEPELDMAKVWLDRIEQASRRAQ